MCVDVFVLSVSIRCGEQRVVRLESIATKWVHEYMDLEQSFDAIAGETWPHSVSLAL